MEREGWDLSGRAAIRLDGVMVGTSDPELFNMPLTRLPALCSWAVTFPIGAWAGDLTSLPLAAHSLDGALDEVDGRYPLALWWYAARGQVAPAPPVVELDPVESDLWWVLGQVPTKISRWGEWIRFEPHQDVNHTVIGKNGPMMRIRSMAHGRTLDVTLKAAWEFVGYGGFRTCWTGDFDALMERLRLHPGVKVNL